MEYAAALAKELFKKLPKVAQRNGGLPACLESTICEKTHRIVGPALKAMPAAKLRRDVLLSGRDWPWDKERKIVEPREPKGHKRDRERDARWIKIEATMEKMDDIIAEFRQSQKPKPKSAIDDALDKFLLTKREQLKRKRRLLQRQTNK
mmetsp:Transcript_38148/g.73164  ORF Transcript_38148/g.73164 Transcript_38148/m.73164 type:complete len:149 (-) Transcript_38148:327-773(-)